MKSLFILMVALAVPFWSLSRSSVRRSTEVIDQAHNDHVAATQQPPQPSITPVPASRRHATAATVRPASQLPLYTPPAPVLGLANGMPFWGDAACPTGEVTFEIERHDPVVAVAAAVVQAPTEECLVEWRAVDLAARTDWTPYFGDQPALSRSVVPDGVSAVRPAAKAIRRALSVQLSMFSAPQSDQQLSALWQSCVSAWSSWEFAQTFSNSDCPHCGAGDWWRDAEQFPGNWGGLSGVGFDVLPPADAEGVRVLEYVVESTHHQWLTFRSKARQGLAGDWLRKVGDQLGEAACHLVQFTATTAQGPVLAEVDRTVPWMAEVPHAPLPQHTPVPSTGRDWEWKWNWRALAQFGWRYSYGGWADLLDRFRNTDREARNLSVDPAGSETEHAR